MKERVVATRASPPRDDDEDAPVSPEAQAPPERQAAEPGDLSARGLHKVSRVARTLADLATEDVVSFLHVSEALSLRAARAALVA